MRAGRCHCENVRFMFTGEPAAASICHCSICRRLTGTAFAAWCAVPDDRFHWLAGRAEMTSYRATERLEIAFCQTCGVTVSATHACWPDRRYIPLATLADDAGIVPRYHQFTGSGAPWYRIGDALPHYAAGPDAQHDSCGWGAVEAAHR